jgi:hypothetical protein
VLDYYLITGEAILKLDKLAGSANQSSQNAQNQNIEIKKDEFLANFADSTRSLSRIKWVCCFLGRSDIWDSFEIPVSLQNCSL